VAASASPAAAAPSTNSEEPWLMATVDP
jgi:hypothetical protein